MNISWQSNVKKSMKPIGCGVLAPHWYRELKQKNASSREINEAVRRYCIEAVGVEKADDSLVELMIATYEA